MAVSSLLLYCGLCVFRVLNALLVRTQFDPDEYWQNLEPAYCEVFRPGLPCEGYTWEWLRRAPPLPSDEGNTVYSMLSQFLEGPVRSYASIMPTYLFYRIIQFLQLDSTWMVARGPLIIHAILIAAPTDWAVWYIARSIRSSPGVKKEHDNWHWWCLFCSITSWFNAYALIRTYSNSVETVLLALSIALVSPELLGKSQDTNKFMIRTSIAFLFGGISYAIRFSSVFAWAPIGFLLAFQRKSFSFSEKIRFLVLFPVKLFGILGAAITLLVDRYFYGFWAIPVLGNFHFNVLLGHGSLYGTHPIYWYIFEGIPAITGLLLPFLLLDLVRRDWTKSHNGNLWIIVLCYTLAHSLSQHKEFRFVLPLMPIFCIIAGQQVQNIFQNHRRRSVWLTVGVLINIIPVLYLGLLHQRAAIDVNESIVHLVRHEPQTYSVHYLMGCHSTPLLSHLHVPPVEFETWTLDCSPVCRSNPTVICESTKFEMDPAEFMEETYFHCSDFEGDTCISDSRILYPDFLVSLSKHLSVMESRISAMRMKEVTRYIHGVNGLRLGNRITVFGADAFASDTFRKVSFLGLIDVSLDEMILFASRNL